MHADSSRWRKIEQCEVSRLDALSNVSRLIVICMTLAAFCATSSQQSTPGPGAYDADLDRAIGGSLSRKSRFNTTDRSPKNDPKALTADVAFLAPSSTLDRRGKTIGPKYPERAPEGGTGPCYVPDPLEGFKKSVTIKNRFPTPTHARSPGPADYDVRHESKFLPPEMGPRPDTMLGEGSPSPGPAAYSVPRDLSEHSHKFTIRPITQVDKPTTDDPGFAYSNLSVTGAGSPMYSLPRTSKEKGGIMDIRRDVDVPGPGAYDTFRAVAEHRLAPSIRPAIAPPEIQRDDVPYENTRRFPELSKGQSILNRGKSLLGNNTGVPGPNYMPESTISRRGVTIGDRIREKPIEETPGPGAYNVQKFPNAVRHSDPAFSFKGAAERDQWMPKGSGPGPGAYKLRSQSSLPKWTIGERSLRQALERRNKK